MAVAWDQVPINNGDVLGTVGGTDGDRRPVVTVTGDPQPVLTAADVTVEVLVSRNGGPFEAKAPGYVLTATVGQQDVYKLRYTFTHRTYGKRVIVLPGGEVQGAVFAPARISNMSKGFIEVGDIGDAPGFTVAFAGWGVRSVSTQKYAFYASGPNGSDRIVRIGLGTTGILGGRAEGIFVSANNFDFSPAGYFPADGSPRRFTFAMSIDRRNYGAGNVLGTHLQAAFNGALVTTPTQITALASQVQPLDWCAICGDNPINGGAVPLPFDFDQWFWFSKEGIVDLSAPGVLTSLFDGTGENAAVKNLAGYTNYAIGGVQPTPGMFFNGLNGEAGGFNRRQDAGHLFPARDNAAGDAVDRDPFVAL